MADSLTPDAGGAANAFPGLQLLGDDTAMGVCVDGVCHVPVAPAAGQSVPEKD